MQVVGTAHGVVRDLMTGKLLVTFAIEGNTVELPEGQLDITAVKHRKGRSLNANSYFHVLVQKIAAAVGTSNTAVKNRLIREYGAYEYINEHIPTFRLKAEYEDAMLSREDMHVKPIGRAWENGSEVVIFAFMRGSHTYDTAEMSRLIDGTVYEAKELGIETLTPGELERMKAAWNTEQRTV